MKMETNPIEVSFRYFCLIYLFYFIAPILRWIAGGLYLPLLCFYVPFGFFYSTRVVDRHFLTISSQGADEDSKKVTLGFRSVSRFVFHMHAIVHLFQCSWCYKFCQCIHFFTPFFFFFFSSVCSYYVLLTIVILT